MDPLSSIQDPTEIPGSTESPQRALYLAVLRLAGDDLGAAHRQGQQAQVQKLLDWAQTAHFDWLCDMADVPPERIRAFLRRQVQLDTELKNIA